MGASRVQWAAIVAIALLAVAIAWFLHSGHASRKPPAPPPATPVSAVAVRLADVPVYIDSLGTVTPTRTVTVITQVNGILDSVAFKEGQHVAKGQVIAHIDSRALEAQLATAQGILVHEDRSPYQAGKTHIRVLLPDKREDGKRFPVIYVLPVEPGSESRFGDGLLEVKKQDLHNKHAAIFVMPTFSHLPWYADHATKEDIRQESYLLKVVVPYIDAHYPVIAETRGRLLLGFSKSGWERTACCCGIGCFARHRPGTRRSPW